MHAFLSPGLIHPTTAEDIATVVGCTMDLMQDPQTGALQDDRYWNALKRDSLHVAVELSGARVGHSNCGNGKTGMKIS
jgi:hypothetical protein